MEIGKLKIDNKVLSSYRSQINNGDQIFIETLSNTKLKTSEDVFDNIMLNLKYLFKKQPVVYSVLLEITTIQKKDLGVNSVIIYMLGGSTIFEKLLDQDTMRHIKNSNFSWSDCLSSSKLINEQTKNTYDLDKIDNYKGIKNIEGLHDKIAKITREQKAKRLIQKTYSKSYRHLVNEETLKLFEMFVEKEISISQIHKGFGSKLARYKDLKVSNERLTEFVKELSGWNKGRYLEKALDVGASIIHNNNDLLTIRIDNYQQSKQLGAGQWCLAYDQSEFINYKNIDNYIYFNYDFEKDPNDKLSMCGIVVRTNGVPSDGHWRDDSDVFDSFDNQVEEDQLDKFESLLPKKFTEEEIYTSFINSANAQLTSEEKNYFLLSNNATSKDTERLNKIFESGELSKNISSNDLEILSRMYDDSNKKSISAKELMTAKKIRELIKQYIEYSDKIVDTDAINSPFLFKMVDKKDFELIKLYVAKVEKTSLEILLNVQNRDIEKPEMQKNILDVIEIYGKSKNDTPLKFDILSNLYKIVRIMDTDMTSFVTDVFKLNNGQIPLLKTLYSLDTIYEKTKTEFNIKEIEVKTKLIELTLIHMDKKPFNRYFGNKDLKEMFPNIPKSTINKLNKYIDKKVINKELISKFNI